MSTGGKTFQDDSAAAAKGAFVFRPPRILLRAVQNVWKKIRHRLEWLGCELLAHGVPLLPHRVCTMLANALGSVAYRFDSRGRAVALANLAVAFSEKYSPREREKIAQKSYRGFARTMLNLFWSPRVNAKNFQKYMTLDGGEVLEKLRAEGRGAIMMCIHQENFEWASLAGGFCGFPGMIVTEDFKNPLLDAVFRRLRQVSGHQMISQDRSMIRLLKHVKRGGFGGILVDLNLPPTQAAAIIETFGMKTCVTLLHAVLAERGGAALVPMESRSFPDGRCHAVLHPPIAVPADATLAQIAQLCWNQLEPWVRENPESWMWAYKHWRYRPADAQRPYPFYANPSSKFEKLWREQTRE